MTQTPNATPLHPGWGDPRINATDLPGLYTSYDLAEARQALAIGDAISISGGGGSGITQPQVQAAVEAALGVKFFREFSERVVKDANGTLALLRRTVNEDDGTATTTTLNLDGSAFVGSLVAPLTIESTDTGLTSTTTKYRAIAAIGVEASIGEQLSLYQIYGDSGSVLFTRWRNDARNTLLSATPTLPTQAIPIEDASSDTLDSLLTATNLGRAKRIAIAVTTATGVSIGDILEQTIVSTNAAPNTVVTESWFNLTTKAAIATPASSVYQFEDNIDTSRVILRGVASTASTIQVSATGVTALLSSLLVENLTGTNAFVFIYENQAVAPVNGSSPLESYRLNSNGTISANFGNRGRTYQNGVWIAFSTNNTTLTLATFAKNFVITGA
jgi:hypothetical protein